MGLSADQLDKCKFLKVQANKKIIIMKFTLALVGVVRRSSGRLTNKRELVRSFIELLVNVRASNRATPAIVRGEYIRMLCLMPRWQSGHHRSLAHLLAAPSTATPKQTKSQSLPRTLNNKTIDEKFLPPDSYDNCTSVLLNNNWTIR